MNDRLDVPELDHDPGEAEKAVIGVGRAAQVGVADLVHVHAVLRQRTASAAVLDVSKDRLRPPTGKPKRPRVDVSACATRDAEQSGLQLGLVASAPT